MIPMDKKLLSDYIDACELIRETEQQIRRLQEKQSETTQDSVRGSRRITPNRSDPARQLVCWFPLSAQIYPAGVGYGYKKIKQKERRWGMWEQGTHTLMVTV